MLKIRIIPTLLWKNEGLVKGVRFDSWRRIGTVLPAVKVYNTRQVDELIVVDISATTEGRAPDYSEIAEFSRECFVPLTVGGGISRVEHIRDVLKAGADKVCINSAAYEAPSLIRRGADKFGVQCIVVSIDAKKTETGEYECYSNCGRGPTHWEVGAWAQNVENMGAGEILVTSIDNDGTMKGYDLDLIRRVTSCVSIPVIASGGAGNYEHMYDAIVLANASAVAAASMFHFTQQTPLGAKKALAGHAVPVRSVGVCGKKDTDVPVM